MSTDARKKLVDEAVALRLGGASYDQIAERQGVTARSVKIRVEKALARMQQDCAESRHLIDLSQIDTAIMKITIAVKNGDVKAVDQLIKLQQQRRDAQARFEAVRRYGETSLRKATEQSIAAMTWLTPTDEAAKQATIVAASAVDDLLAAGDTGKAVFALPHLINSLKAIGGTPAERKALNASGDDEDTSELGQMRKRARNRRGGLSA